MRALIVTSGLFLALSASVSGCGSRADTLCDLVCECEHCNDYDEEIRCAGAETSVEVAQAYGCEDRWNDYADCFEENGTCDETKASYSTASPGACDKETDQQIPCADDVQCSVINGAYCASGSCRTKACVAGGPACTSDAECAGQGGADRCAVSAKALLDCQVAASDDPTLGFFFGGSGSGQSGQGHD